MRGAIYIDGFNLYHAIDDLNLNYLKWNNLWKLGEAVMKGHAKPLVKAVWCSAFRRGDEGAKSRHKALHDALKIEGVTVLMGHETQEPMKCPSCKSWWDVPREKATDINLALAAFQDGIDDIYDAAFFVTADTDQAATFSFLRKRLPHKKLFIVTPPKRDLSKHLFALADGKVTITERMLDDCVMREKVGEGAATVFRPREYDPPAGWMHPEDRPRRR